MTETWTRSAIGQIAAILMVSWGGLAYAALPAVPEDAPVIQAQMQELATRLDSPAYAADVSWDEHIVLVYRLAQHREPTPVEFRTLCALRDEGRLKRSDVLSLVLRGDAPGPSWDQCRALLREAGAKSVQGGADTRAVGRRLAAIPLRRPRLASVAHQPIRGRPTPR